MSQKITRLSNEVINRIAAGEVIEQPASIVKELIENSLDAGARTIAVSVEKGGERLICIEDDGCGMSLEDAKLSIVKELIENSLDAGARTIAVSVEKGGERLICIEDDGCGMSLEDAKLSIERHATSKIRTEEDLESLMTMGFRGEALAAISAVSRFEMKTFDGGIGTWISASGGVIEKVEPCARNCGTTVTVRDLFFNTPARKKFLKSSAANLAQISRVVETIALAHPEVSFSLVVDGKNVLKAFQESKEKRIRSFLPFLSSEVKGVGLWGFIGSPEEAKGHRREQYLFINRRPLFSPLISRAVKMGYGTRISTEAHPSFVLFLDVSPDRIDVNVHPQKKEVRFADEKAIFHLFEKSVSSSF